MSKKRIEWIDCVRAISMMLIIISHTYVAGFWLNFVFAVNVPIFFVLSGYLTRKKDVSRTAKNGIKTLIIPYIATTVVMFLISLISVRRHVPGMITTDHWYHYLVAGLYGIGSPTHQSIIHNANIPAIGAIWFLLAMYFGNIIYQLIRKLSDRYSKLASTIILIIFGILFAVFGFWISHFVQLPWSIGPAFISIIFYVSGYLFKTWNLMTINVKNTLFSLVGLILWVVAAFKGPFWFNTGFATQPFLDIIGAIGGSYFLMYIFKILDAKISLSFLARLGRLALITLSFHIICLNLFGDTVFLSGKLLIHGVSPIMTGVLMDIYRICLCWIATLILSRFKIVRRIFAIR